MPLLLTDEQKLLARTASEVISKQSPVSRLRALRNDKDELGYSPQLWKYMAELGWTAIPFSEADGGLGMGMAEVVLVTEALGRGLAPEPYIACVMMGAQALSLGGSTQQRTTWLPSIIDGSKMLALAYQEPGARYDLCKVDTRARRDGDGFVLEGDKHHVLGGFGADALVVSARTGDSTSQNGGISLFLIPTDRAGVELGRQWRMDTNNAAIVQLRGVRASATDVVGKLDAGAQLLRNVVDRATVALCGEMLGGMNEALDRTLAYLQERTQFGAIIGTFQALKHRAARLYIQAELSRSAVMAAARALDADAPDAANLVCLAKARCSDAYVLIG
ncbi:MAG: acyl-CoA dehydrogenase family protein, partial [Myxococcales bacterium]|nr:acyl-CoA dehydrogenase family protein [Myxococcales bacterium]